MADEPDPTPFSTLYHRLQPAYPPGVEGAIAIEDPIVLPFHDLCRIEGMHMFYATCMADGDTPRTGADVEKTVNEVLGDMMAGRTSKNQAHQIKDAAESRIKKADRDEGAFRATRSRP